VAESFFKALGNKDFNISCYLLVLGPAFEFRTPDVGDGRGEAGQSLALFAVNYPTTENLVVVNAIGLDVRVVARVGFEVGQSVIGQFIFNVCEVMEGDWFVMCGIFENRELEVRPIGV
jgi:hypothetical protein